ncbi:MAG: hypothetical protein IJR27_06250, partial [Synergistaceae bacterium]|nr:hypothetical protein [Synergistaceae bacterium]
MHKTVSKFLLTALVLSCVLGGQQLLVQGGSVAQAAQTLNGKDINGIDDIVKAVHGELSLSKKGLITIRGGNDYGSDSKLGAASASTYVDVFAQTFSRDAAPSKARKIFTYPNSGTYVRDLGEGFFDSPNYFAPAVSRRLYNGKRAFMFHNIAPNGELKYYFKTLSNTISPYAVGKTPDELIDSIRISDFGEYTPKAIPSSYDIPFSMQVYGTGVMEVKGYENEIFVVAAGGNPPGVVDKTIRLEFFAVSADNAGNMTSVPLTALTHETPFRDVGVSHGGRLGEGGARIVSLAVGDFDGDKYNNEAALMITTRQELRLFVYRLILSKGNLVLKSLGDPTGMPVPSTNQWGHTLESQPVTDMAAGDFDGDGVSEIAVFFKEIWRATGIKHHKGWPDGPKVGNIHCKVHKWNAETGAFDTAETVKDYHGEKIDANPGRLFPDDYSIATGVVGLRAVTADLNGDGMDEIATVLVGYSHRKKWNGRIREYRFDVFPHLAVWKFENGITPIHDDAHVKGGIGTNTYYRADGDGPRYDFGPLYELIKNQTTPLLEETPLLHYNYYIGSLPYEDDEREPVTNPDNVNYMFALQNIYVTAGPFTGTIGTFKTVDDIAIAWKDKKGGYVSDHWYDTTGNDCVKIFKTKVSSGREGNKIFDGFEDGKLVLQDKSTAHHRETFRDSTGTLRGLVAVDLASEGVELGRPVHLKQTFNRSYIAALSAIPYHVDTVGEDGTYISEQPVNFTYSDSTNGGKMTVEYGKSTTDSNTNSVQQDLSQSIETMFLFDPQAKGGSAFEKVKGLIGFASSIGNFAQGILNGGLTTEQKKELVWQPDDSTPLDMFSGLMDFFTDRVDKINQLTNDKASTTTIDKNITATTHDAIFFTDTSRHIWRYPVMTRPLPMWLASCRRIDSTQIDNPTTVSSDKELFITFTMSENSPLHASTSITDSLYQPLHEEGNFFSYTPHIADVEGYNEAGLLVEKENRWDFSRMLIETGITFEKASSDMQHTETKVTPGGFTSFISFFERLFKGDNTKSIINMPNSDNPKTFTKQYSTTERVRYSLQAGAQLDDHTADHTVIMQPFVAKEGAMSFATAVQLNSKNDSPLWDSSSLYQQKSDPALYLPMKFVKKGSTFTANLRDKPAMQIRGIKFYASDFAFFTDNRLANGQNYEIRVPLYNASFKDTGDFKVRLSWAEDNTMAADKTTIGETTVSLGGWKNDRNNNKGFAVFNWTPNLTSSSKTKKEYYFYVEIDPEDKLDEVHEARYEYDYEYDDLMISDYGGNNTGFYPFYAYNIGDPETSGGTVLSGNAEDFSAAAETASLTPLYFTDGDGNRINDMLSFILEHKDESFVTITASFNYNGPEAPYAFFAGYVLTQSGKQKVPGAGINTIVDLNNPSLSDIEDVFMVQDIAL